MHTECIVANTEVECVQYKFTGFITNIFQCSGELCLEVKPDSSLCTIHISQTLTGWNFLFFCHVTVFTGPKWTFQWYAINFRCRAHMGMVTFVADLVIKKKVVTFSALNAVKKNLMSRTKRMDASWMFKKKTHLWQHHNKDPCLKGLKYPLPKFNYLVISVFVTIAKKTTKISSSVVICN